MADSCFVIPEVITPKGNTVDSYLGLDLIDAFGREIGLQLWQKSKDKSLNDYFKQKKWYKKTDRGEVPFDVFLKILYHDDRLKEQYPIIKKDQTSGTMTKSDLKYYTSSEYLIKRAWEHLKKESGFVYDGIKIAIDPNENYTIEEAVHLVGLFNRHHDYKNTIMADYEQSGSGYRIVLKEGTKSNRKELMKKVNNLELLNRIQNRLDRVGIKLRVADFPKEGLQASEEEDRIEGYNYILEYNEDKPISLEAARKVGSLLVDGISNQPLIQRLVRTLEGRWGAWDSGLGGYTRAKNDGTTLEYGEGQSVNIPGSRQQIYNDLGFSKDDIIRIESSNNPAVELAKELVARELFDSNWQTSNTGSKSLVSRFVEWFKTNILNPIKSLKDAYKKDSEDALDMAKDIANVFLDTKYDKEIAKQIDEINAIENYKFTTNMKVARDAYNHLLRILKAVDNKEGVVYKEVKNLSLTLSDAVYLTYEGEKKDDGAIVYSAMRALCDMADSLNINIGNLWLTLEGEIDDDQYGELIVDHGDQLREIEIMLNEFHAVLSSLKMFVGVDYNKKNTITNSHGTKEISESLDGMILRCNYFINNVEEGLGVCYDKIAVKFLETQLGYKYVRTTQHKLLRKRYVDGKKTRFEKGRIVSVEDMLHGVWTTDSNFNENRNRDISWIDHYLLPMSHSRDFVLQAIDVINKSAKSKVNKTVIGYQNQLRLLHTKIQYTQSKVIDPLTGEKRDLKESDFYEKDSNGALTGNFLTRYNWDKYDSDLREFYRQMHIAFNNQEDQVKFKPSLVKAEEFKEFIKEPLKKWHKTHSRFDEEKQMLVPLTKRDYQKLVKDESDLESNEYYDNEDYYALTDNERNKEFIVILEEIHRIKEELDDMLVDQLVPNHRAPQFRSTLIDKMRNTKMLVGKMNMTENLRSQIGQWFVEDSDVSDFGYNLNMGDISIDPLADPSDDANILTEKIPLYGINKLKKYSTQLSTDVAHSLLCYANMAVNYNYTRRVARAMDSLGKSILSRDYVDNSNYNKENDCYLKYKKYMQTQIYGVGMKKYKLGKIIGNRLVQAANYYASLYFLGGNLKGATVNNLMAFTVLLREGMTGEEFQMESWRKANATYLANIPSMMAGALFEGGSIPNNKISTFVRYFATMNNSSEKISKWDPSHYSGPSLGDIVLAPYTVGDHYSSTIGYLAKGYETTLYDLDGKSYNLVDAYGMNITEYWDEIKEKFQEEGNDKLTKKLTKVKEFSLTKDFFKNKEDIEEFKFLHSIKIAMGEFEKLLLEGLDDVEEEDIIKSLKSVYDKLISLDKDKVKSMFEKARIEFPIGEPANAIKKEFDEKYADKAEKLLNYIKGRTTELKWNTNDEIRFENEARQLNIRMHGVFNHLDSTKFQNNFLGHMVMAMRGYVLGYAQMNFGENKDKIIGGKIDGFTDQELIDYEKIYGEIDEAAKVLQLKNEEGMLISFLKLFLKDDDGKWHAGSNFLAFALSGFTKLPPRKAGSIAIDDWAFMDERGLSGYSRAQWYNFRRLEYTILIMLFLSMLRWLLKMKHEENIETYKQAKSNGIDYQFETGFWGWLGGATYYNSSRMIREFMGYIIPSRPMFNEGKSILTLWPVAVDALADTIEIVAIDSATMFKGLHSFDYLKESDPEQFKIKKKEMQDRLGDKYSTYYYTQDGPGYRDGQLKAWVKTRDRLPYIKDYKAWKHYDNLGSGFYSAYDSYLYGTKQK